MKTLYLLRHAKSAWDNPGLSDHDRPLAPRGEKACRLMGEYMANRGVRPDIIICSTATRAQQTFAAVSPFVSPLPTVLDTRDAYMADPDELLALLARLDAHKSPAKSAMIVAHNPGLYMLANMLARHGDKADLARLRHKLPTCAFVELVSDSASWRNFRRGVCELTHYRTPQHLAYL